MSKAPPVIDVHCHVAGEGHGGNGCLISRAMAENWRYGFFRKAFGVPQEVIERDGDRAVCRKVAADVAASRAVDAAVILALGLIRK